MKIHFNKEEYWPVYVLPSEAYGGSVRYGETVELTDKELDRVIKAMEEFDAVQEMIRSRMNE